MIGAGPFVGRMLSRDQVAQAYPLLALSGSDIGPEQWRWLALALLTEAAPPPAGIMTLQSEQGYIHGLFRFRVVVEREGKTLRIDDLYGLDFFDRSLARSLVAVLEGLARDFRCVAIDVTLPSADRESDLHRRLQGAGYIATARSLRKSSGLARNRP
ncbi:MAG: hypothetical protein ACREER_04500 [Alphaproteobacteria bacterium]